MTANGQLTGQGQSLMTIEWTNQHGCGGDEDTDPHKLNCNIVLQYMCQVEANTATGVMRSVGTSKEVTFSHWTNLRVDAGLKTSSILHFHFQPPRQP